MLHRIARRIGWSTGSQAPSPFNGGLALVFLPLKTLTNEEVRGLTQKEPGRPGTWWRCVVCQSVCPRQMLLRVNNHSDRICFSQEDETDVKSHTKHERDKRDVVKWLRFLQYRCSHGQHWTLSSEHFGK